MDKKFNVAKEISGDEKIEKPQQLSEVGVNAEPTAKPRYENSMMQNTDKELDEQLDKGLKPWFPPTEQQFEEQKGQFYEKGSFIKYNS